MARSLDGVLIKKAHSKETYTYTQLEEFKKCADPISGPLYFMTNFFYIQHPVRGRIIYEPYDFQKRLLETYHNNRYSINMLPRQTGKTTTASGYLLWYAMFNPDSTILVTSYKEKLSTEIMQRIRYAYESCPNHIRAGVVGYQKKSVDFDNGSRIISDTTTENTGRGLSISLLYCDELAFVRPTVAREFWTSLSPTLTSGGSAIITSTPNSDEDQFAEIWRLANHTYDAEGNEIEIGINDFKAFQAHWWEHPDRNDEWKIKEIAKIGEENFRREHGCEFIISDETLINSSFLLKMKGNEPIYKIGAVRWFKQINPDSSYFIALDPSLGTGGDYAAIQIFESPSMEQVGEWRHNLTPVPQQVKILISICNYISEIVSEKEIYYSVENNTIGEAVLLSIADVGEENIKGYFISESKRMGHVKVFRKGFNTTQRIKLSTCAKLKTLVETEKMKINSKALISELKTFIANGTSYSAKIGETDDLVMSTLLILRMANEIKKYTPDLDERIRDNNDIERAPMPFIMI